VIPDEAVEAATRVLLGYTGGCVCHEGYTVRNLTDPDCRYHDVPPEVAREILEAAAPHLKPRAITTAEELDALPIGAVVLSETYTGQSGQQISFQRWDDGDWHRGARSSDTHPDNFLPATVIYEPADS
jgi:hypothetical protein